MNKLADTREKRAKLNIVVSLGGQMITLICGLIVPRMLLSHFGSEAYGATASISQFLAYISLLEGGIGGVARAALYKPLAEHNLQVISEIVSEIKRFFRVIAFIFLAYVLVLAYGFQTISKIECFDWIHSFFLVIVISISTFAQYFIGISNAVLIQAAQKTYITNIINISTLILNTILTVFLVNIGSNLIIVKLVSSCVFVLRPIFMMAYVKKNYQLTNCRKREKTYLDQKWAGLGQHIAYFIHLNTDIAVLTVFADLKAVAVYSVYNMVVAQMQHFIASFATGMEALFGDMIAKDEIQELHRTFEKYELLISIITVVLFSVTAVMVVPFIKIYTMGVNDANYVEPVFALLLILASIVYCLRMPYHSMTIAAGHFKQTQVAAYGEAIINIGLSVVLVIRYGLIGVAVGTVVATTFRLLYYAFYLTKHIFCRKMKDFVKREFVNLALIFFTIVMGNAIAGRWRLKNYFAWACCSACVTVLTVIVVVGINSVFYKEDVKRLLKIR